MIKAMPDFDIVNFPFKNGWLCSRVDTKGDDQTPRYNLKNKHITNFGSVLRAAHSVEI